MSVQTANAYTAISFAPVQGFIEKSRKLRDLFGASMILSYLSYRLIDRAADKLGKESIISPGLINQQQGMPNRILLKGYLSRDEVKNWLLQEWQAVLTICRHWIEKNLGIPESEYFWAQQEEQKGKQKGEWERWASYTWEVFWGSGDTPMLAMQDLETRKLKRDWTGINWIGESSSLTGTDAIAWNRLGQEHSQPGRALKPQEQAELQRFYARLSWLMDNPDRPKHQPFPSDAELEAIAKNPPEDAGKYIAPNERLSIPELVKRLVTYEGIARAIGIDQLDRGFTDIIRRAEGSHPDQKGHWTGWFMGDGDQVGKYLKTLTSDRDCQAFSQAMRSWGKDFEKRFDRKLGRIIYAGGDDFLGVIYSSDRSKPIAAPQAIDWLRKFPAEWKKHEQNITVSVGFVWAAAAVPQRDVLQHCRQAEKRAKERGRNRVTIRVVFNSGQFVQWTCPWEALNWIDGYRDREGGKNWAHLYQDWAHLKARHAIRLTETDRLKTDKTLALKLFDYYFPGAIKQIEQMQDRHCEKKGWTCVAGDDQPIAIVQWIDDLIQVGWQLCSNT